MIKAVLAVICNMCGEVRGRGEDILFHVLGRLMRRMEELTPQASSVCTAFKSR